MFCLHRTFNFYGSVSHEDSVGRPPFCFLIRVYGTALRPRYKTRTDKVGTVKQNRTCNSNQFICFRERIWHQKERHLCSVTFDSRSSNSWNYTTIKIYFPDNHPHSHIIYLFFSGILVELGTYLTFFFSTGHLLSCWKQNFSFFLVTLSS